MIFTCTGFLGFNPVGTAAVVVAESADSAVRILNRELRKRRLPGKVTPDMLTELSTIVPHAIILNAGDY